MNMNLNRVKYRDRSQVSHTSTDQEWIDTNKKKEGAYCYYTGNTQNEFRFGKLNYSYAVTIPKGLAPNSWSIPID